MAPPKPTRKSIGTLRLDVELIADVDTEVQRSGGMSRTLVINALLREAITARRAHPSRTNKRTARGSR